VAERVRITDVGNVKIAGTALRATTEGTNHLSIFDGTAPVGTLANGCSLYSTAGELRVMDAGGTATLLSPHGFLLFTPDKSLAFPWSYLSKNEYLGKEINVDMNGAIAELERLSGKKFIYLRDIPKLDWDADQAKTKQEIEASRVMEAMQGTVEVPTSAAIESVEIMKTIETGKLKKSGKFKLVDGVVMDGMIAETQTVGTGEFEMRLKSGITFDENTGTFSRYLTRAEAESLIERWTPAVPPKWMQERMRKE
jgi:hypothetical protein